MRSRVYLPTILFVFSAGCSGSDNSAARTDIDLTPDTRGADTSSDLEEVADEVADTSADLSAEPDTSLADASELTDRLEPSDSLAGTDTQTSGLQLPPDARPAVLDWALQSLHSDQGFIEHPEVLALADGGVALVARFNGSVTLGRFTVTAPPEPHRGHTLFARLDAQGEVTALTRFCDRCGGSFERFAMTELPLGRVAVAGISEGDVVLSPGTDGEVRRDAGHDLFVGVLSELGALERWSFLGSFAGHGEVRALATIPGDGGLVIGGAGKTLALTDGPDLTVPGTSPWSRAFIVGVSSDLTPIFAEQLGGNAASNINLLYATANGLIAVGDFGGLDNTFGATFGAGLPGALDLAVVSATEAPTNELFLSRWSLPATPGRLVVGWAKRVAHRSSPPRDPTWIRPLDLQSLDEGFEFRMDRADEILRDASGQYATGGPVPWSRMVVRVGGEGAAWRFASTVAPIQPHAEGYLSVSPRPHDDNMISLVATGGPRFILPEPGSDPDGLTRDGFVLATWRADGRLDRAGMLLATRPAASYEPTFVKAVPSLAGSAIVVVLGTAPMTLEPSEGEPVVLHDRVAATQPQRVVIARFHLQ